MALTSDIIQRAYRESNLIPLGASPNAAQTTEALDMLNGLLISTVGNEVADALDEFIIGGDFSQLDLLNDYIPDNVRLVFNLEDGPIEMGLDPYPKDGQRLAMVDTSGNISTNTITLFGNGRTIEASDSITLSTDYINRQWMYRADTGNWVLISELTDLDLMPFPTEFDDYFVTMLAMRLNPRYGQAVSQETMRALQRYRSQLQARYSQTREILPDVDWRSVPSQRRGLESSDLASFDTGKIYPWK